MQEKTGTYGLLRDVSTTIFPFLKNTIVADLIGYLGILPLSLYDRLGRKDLLKALTEIEQVRQEFLVQGNNKSVIPFFDHYKIRYKVDGTEHIPADKKCVLAANHPSSLLDALVIADIMGGSFQSLQILALFFAKVFDPTGEYIVPVNFLPMGQSKIEKLQYKIADGVQQGKPLLIFPAGAVSKRNASGEFEKKRKTTALRVAVMSQSPIIPIRLCVPVFDPTGVFGKSRFHIHRPYASLDQLRQAKNFDITVKVGQPINPLSHLTMHGGDYASASQTLKGIVYSL